MPDTSQLETALINAHNAGDKQAATMLAAEIQRMQSTKAPSFDPSEGRLPLNVAGFDTGLTMPQGVSRFMAGAGKAMMDTGRGIGQLVGAVSPQEIDAIKKQDAPLMNTGAGMAGNIAGNIAANAPLAMIPGANTVAGGAAIGGLGGLLQPVGSEDSRMGNVAMGAGAGAAVPAAIRTAKALRAGLVDPFTEAGRTKIAGSVIKRTAADPASVAERLRTAKGATEGFVPTAGQAANDAGVASLERTVRAIDPAGFDVADKSQRGALVAALKNIAGTPEARAQQTDLVEETAGKLYGQAFKESMPVTPELSALARRPSMQSAEVRAQKLAAELGVNRSMKLADLNPRTIATEPRMPQPSSVLADVELRPATSVAVQPRRVPSSTVETAAERFNPYSNVAPKQAQVTTGAPGGIIPGSGRVDVPAARGIRQLDIPSEFEIAGSRSMEIPPLDSVPVRDMHTIKMGMDALMGDPTLGIAGQEAKAINKTRNALVEMMPESYQTARQAHIDLNRPIHQMDIGQALHDRFVPALAEKGDLPFKLSADAYANALRSGDQVAKTVTGMKNAKMRNIMSPEQMSVLEGVAKDSNTRAAAESLGRGAGSDTVQKIAMSNIAAEAGVPNWMSSIARVPGGWAKRAGDVIYGSADDQIRNQLSELLRNPQEAAKAMQAAGVNPSRLAEWLKMSGQSGALALPATVQASE